MINGLTLKKKESTKCNLMRCFKYLLVLDHLLVAKLVYRNLPHFNSS